jgi:triosephosphate isomerase
MKPTYASYEPPELIGRSDISVATAQPEIIAKASVLSKEAGIPLIVGAGIGSGKDVKKSVELGATGVAVASYVIKAENQKAAILDLAEGFK